MRFYYLTLQDRILFDRVNKLISETTGRVILTIDDDLNLDLIHLLVMREYERFCCQIERKSLYYGHVDRSYNKEGFKDWMIRLENLCG